MLHSVNQVRAARLWRTAQAAVDAPGWNEVPNPTDAWSVEWLAPRQALDPAQLAWGNPTTPSKVRVVSGSARDGGTRPGEVSKTWRLTEIARDVAQGAGLQADVPDLSPVTSAYGRHIHPCKGCVSSQAAAPQ